MAPLPSGEYGSVGREATAYSLLSGSSTSTVSVTPSPGEQDMFYNSTRSASSVPGTRESGHTPSQNHPSTTKPPLAHTQASSRRVSSASTSQYGSEYVEGGGPPPRLSQEAVGRWSSALGNLQELGKVVDGLSKTLESAVYLDESEYSIQAQLQHYKNTLKVTTLKGSLTNFRRFQGEQFNDVFRTTCVCRYVQHKKTLRFQWYTRVPVRNNLLLSQLVELSTLRVEHGGTRVTLTGARRANIRIRGRGGPYTARPCKGTGQAAQPRESSERSTRIECDLTSRAGEHSSRVQDALQRAALQNGGAEPEARGDGKGANMVASCKHPGPPFVLNSVSELYRVRRHFCVAGAVGCCGHSRRHEKGNNKAIKWPLIHNYGRSA
eukprot:9499846-Pyramimonas_sp.AAC.3